MNDFFNSLKADLLDRRLRPIVALAVIALLGAGAYALLAGGGSSAAPTSASAVAPGTPVTASASLSTSSTTPNTAAAETTEGEAEQHHGGARDPFNALPQAKVATAVVAKTASPASTSGGSSGSSSGGSSASETKSSSTETTTTKPKTPAKPKVSYHVAVLFGTTPPPAPAASAPLTPYENLKLLAPLPSATAPLIVFRGVTAGGKSATFTLVSEAIIHGDGTCLPNASQCQAIDLKPGQSENFEYLGSEGQPVSYELTVVSIDSEKASASSVKDMLGASSQAGRKLLEHAGLVAIPGLRASSQAGILVFANHPAFAARAHAARRRHGGH